MINYENLTKAQVLAGLYNASKPQGMGFLQYDPKDMTVEEAEEILKKTQYFDYLKGRVMKVDLSKEGRFEEHGYDRDNGNRAAQRVIDALSQNNKEYIEQKHKDGVIQSAVYAAACMDQKTIMEEKDGFAVLTLGLSDCEEVLSEAVEKAIVSNGL